MTAPSNFSKPPKDINTAPPIKLELEYVHGYKGDNAKNNLRYMQDQNLCYYIAGVGVVFNPETNTQKFFMKHTDDVTCIDFHPDGRRVVTGENGKRPKAYIWDADTCEPIHTLYGHGIMNTVTACAFSASGNRVVLIAGDDNHHMAVYDTESGACIAEGKGTQANVISVQWQDDQTFTLVGSKLFCQVTIVNNSFKKTNGKFGNNDQRIGSIMYSGNTGLTGAINGSLYQWNGPSIVGTPKKLHARLIDAICVTKSHILTGGRDSKITVMDKSFKVLFTIDMSQFKGSNSTQVRAITINSRGDRMCVGTFGHEIIQVPINLQSNTCNMA